MRSKVQCPVCDKRVRVSEADAGQQAWCPACGARFDVPPPPLLGELNPAPAPAAGDGAGIASDKATEGGALAAAALLALAAPTGETAPGGAPAASPHSPAAPVGSLRRADETPSPGLPPLDPPPLSPAPTPEEIRAVLDARRNDPRRHHPVLWLLAGVAISAIVLLAVLAINRRAGTWEQDHRAEVVALKNKAESLAAAGQLREAHQQYLELDKLIGGRTLHDPEVHDLVARARAEQERVYHTLLAGVQRPGLGTRSTIPAAAAMASGTGRTTISAHPPADPVGPTVPLAPAGPAIASAGSPGFVPLPSAETTPGPAPETTGPAPPVKPAPVAPPELSPKPVPPVPRVTPRPVPRPVPDDPGVLTDERIGLAIQKGADYLLSRFDPDQHTLRTGRDDRDYDVAYYCGEDSLAVYALLQCGEAISDRRLNVRGPEMRALVEAMKKLPCDGTYQTYARAIRATALALKLHERPEDFPALSADARWLVQTCDEGAYTYTNRLLHTGPNLIDGWHGTFPRGGWDNSNSQYGLLGVWSAIEADPRIEVPISYWRAVDHHWTDCQTPAGPWGYTHGGAKVSMTCAGLASLFVAHEYLEPAMTGAGHAYAAGIGGSGTTMVETAPVGRPPFTPALKKGLDWFEEDDNAVSVDGAYWGYTLYGVERVGLASGFKYFGKHDWYRELARQAIYRQRNNGSWGDGVIDTSYSLLFLARGRHPILMNKLRFDGYWANRPRDAANLARYAGRQLERPLNWQVINIKSAWTDWTDSPVLYLASHEPPKLSDEDVNGIRNFVLAGGVLFTNADAGSPSFNAFAVDLAHRLFKNYELTDLPPNHPIYNINFRPEPRPPLKYVTNGARVLMVHSPTDLATHWQKREDRPWENGAAGKGDPVLKMRQLAPFQLGANLFIYAAGKVDLRNRLQTAWVTAPDATPLTTVKVARLKYAGNWDPEPFAWKRYAHWFQRQTGYKLDVRTIALKDLMPGDAPIAHLTGTARTVFTPAEAAAAKAYVESGGVLLIDMCGGTGAFDQTLPPTLLNPAFQNAYPSAIARTHPLLRASASGMEDLSKPRQRPFAVERRGKSDPMPMILAFGKGHVLATNLDITCGLLGTDTWGILGYDPAYAQALVKNLIFWSLDGQPDQ